MVYPVVMYGCESWTTKKAEHQRTNAFELWCWRSLLRVLWTARRSNKSILKDISSEYPLEGLMLNLKLQCFGHQIWRANSLEDMMLGRPCPFHHRGLECKSRKSRDTWNNRQVWPWSTKWNRAKANRVLPRERKVIANTLFQQHKRRLHMDITRWKHCPCYMGIELISEEWMKKWMDET